MDLRRALQVIWRRKLFIILFATIVTALVFVVSMQQANEYESTARIIVETQSATLNAIAGQNIGDKAPDDRQVATLATFVVTPEIARRVKGTLASDLSVEELLDSARADPDLNANVIEVTARRPSAKETADIATAFATEFVDWRRETQQESLDAALEITQREIERTQQDTFAYQELVNRRSELEVLKTLTNGGVQIGEAAGVPSEPASPRPLRNAAVALGAALILGVGLAFLREMLDVNIHTVEELEQLSTLPIVCTIDALPKEYRKSGRLIVLEEPRSPYAESYRRLRTSLDFLNFNHDLKTILVTSPLPGQGKSTTIGNLAVVLVRSGHRVTIVEGDLRRPSLHTYFQTPNVVGLASVVAGSAKLADAVKTLTFHEGTTTVVRTPPGRAAGSPRADLAGVVSLRLLTSGPLPPNPGDIVTSAQFSDILAELGKTSDYVLVDAPPVLAVGDAGALAGKVDGVLVVVRLEETTRQMLAEVETFLERSPARALGLVVAGVPRQKQHEYRYTGYYEA